MLSFVLFFKLKLKKFNNFTTSRIYHIHKKNIANMGLFLVPICMTKLYFNNKQKNYLIKLLSEAGILNNIFNIIFIYNLFIRLNQ